MKLMTIGLLTLLMTTSSAAAPVADSILAAMDRNRDYGTISYTGTMEITVGGEVRVKKMKVLGEGARKALVEFVNPQDQGTKYLKINKDLWIYFPSEQDMVKISGHLLKEGMMGSDVSYEDALESDSTFKKYKATVDADESVDGHACWVLTLEAVVKDAPYYKRRLWIDKELYLPWKAEMFAKSGKLLKESRILEVRTIGMRHFPVKSEIVNKLRANSKTVFEMTDVLLDLKLDEKIFSLQNLQR